MCKDQKSIQLSTTTDPGYQWESDKLTGYHHKREPRGQSFPAGDKAQINRRTQRHKTQDRKNKTKQKKDPQKKYRLGTVCKIFYWRA